MEQTQTQTTLNITQFELSNQIFDCELFSKVKLTASARLVLIVLCRYYPKIYPCQQTIAKKSGLTTRSVINALSELKSKVLILVECNHSNTYRFTSTFFELTKISHSSSKTFTKERENFSSNKNKYKNNNKPYQNNVTEVKYISSYQTKQNIQKAQNITKGSPLDLSKPEAIKWLNSLPEILTNSFFAKEVRKKYNLK